MKYSAAAVAAFVAGASASYAQSNETAPVYTTEVLTAYTTYCPEPTTISYGTNTYTITEATTLTITDCPCTVSKPVASTSAVPSYPVSVPSVPASVPGVPAPSGSAPVPSAPGTPVPYPTGNSTVPAIPTGTAPGVPTTEAPTETQPSATGSESSTPSAPISTGAAARSFAPAGLAGLVGLAAYLL